MDGWEIACERKTKKTSPLFGDFIEEHKSVMHIQENALTLDIVVI